MRPYAHLLPSRHVRSLRDCSDSMRCDSLCTCAAHAGRHVLERRHRSAVVAPAMLALSVALYMAPDATVQVRRIVQLHARAHDALASRASLHCVSRRARPWIARLMSVGRFCASAGAWWLLDKRAGRAEDPFNLTRCSRVESGLPCTSTMADRTLGRDAVEAGGRERTCGHVAALSSVRSRFECRLSADAATATGLRCDRSHRRGCVALAVWVVCTTLRCGCARDP